MPDANAAAAGGGGADQGAERGGRGGGLLQGIIRAVIMWYVMKQFSGGGQRAGAPGTKGGPPVVHLAPALPQGAPMDVHVYVSEHEDWQRAAHDEEPIWIEPSVSLGVGEPRKYTYSYRPSAAVHSNGSIFVHAVFTPPGASPDPQAEDHDRVLTFGKTNQLNVYLPKQKEEEGVNLLGRGLEEYGDQEKETFAQETPSNETVILSFLKPNVTVAMINEFKTFPSHQIPPQYKGVLQINEKTERYYPHVWFNDFWLLRDYLVLVNESLTEIPIQFSIEPLHPIKFILFVQMEQSFSMQEQWGMSSASEADEVKRIFLEGNPFFLTLTVFVSLLHSVFDVLAFKNDVTFWKDNKSMKGLSARTVLINAGCQLVIFLYLLDSPETSTVVLLSTGVGAAIEFWKVTKAMNVSIHRSSYGIPYLKFKDRESYVESQTDKHDADAMRYLSYALYPLVAGYAIYALIYKTHKSWYSWILHSLVGAVYTFGFILMCPQLYLNYKLKSVAHLPWRQMTYKFLNTIIDDLFAFVIKMPLLHRLSVFRDDVVFLIYLYQRWIYRVDKTRANEFGYVEEPSQNDEGTSEPSAAKEETKKEK